MQTADVAKAVDDTLASKTVGAVLGQVDTTDLLEVNQKGDWMINQKSKAVTSVTTGDGKQATSTAQSVADGVVGDVGTSGIQGDIATTAQKLVKCGLLPTHTLGIDHARRRALSARGHLPPRHE